MVSRLMSLIGKPMADSNRPGFRMKRFVTKYFMLPFLAIEQIFRLQEGIVRLTFVCCPNGVSITQNVDISFRLIDTFLSNLCSLQMSCMSY